MNWRAEFVSFIEAEIESPKEPFKVSNQPRYPGPPSQPQGQQMYAPPAQHYSPAAAPQNPGQLKHSGLGIVSTIGAFACGIGSIATIFLAGYIATNDPATLEDETSVVTNLIGLGIIGCMAGLVIGFGLGIGGLCQPRRRKATAIIGLVLNGLALLGVCGIMALGLAVSASETGY